ncbi:MAG: GHKL domain-containing protein [Parasporobacterium sp.]|nr:GHKL domain-containing protein [Parasporobacterium sp.]
MTLFLIYRMMHKIALSFTKKIWLMFNVVMGAFLIITILFMTAYPDSNPSKSTEYLYTALFLIFFIMSLFIIHFLTFVAATFKENEKIHILRNNYSSIEESLLSQTENMRVIKKMRHDIKNNLLLLNTLIKNNNIKEAVSLIDQSVTQIEGTTIGLSQSSGHGIIDAIIANKAGLAKERNITFSYKLDSIPEISIDSIDISSVVTNLLDNALEAAEREENGFAEIKIINMESYISINVINSCTSVPLTSSTDKHILITSKADKSLHGFGTEIISDIAKKYNGSFVWKVSNNVFSANVIMKKS